MRKLSQKSLDMCTEVLGCETGKGCYDGSNTLIHNVGDGDEDDEMSNIEAGREKKLWSSKVVPGVIDCEGCRPPMLKSMARGQKIQLKRCMENGMYVLKAAVVQSSSHFLTTMFTSDVEEYPGPGFDDCDGCRHEEKEVGTCRECNRMAYACKEDSGMLSCGNHRYIRCF